jgi:hypothetical protein
MDYLYDAAAMHACSCMYTAAELAIMVPGMQVFYRTHIVAFVLFMLFGFIHHFMLWAYTMPGMPPFTSLSPTFADHACSPHSPSAP